MPFGTVVGSKGRSTSTASQATSAVAVAAGSTIIVGGEWDTTNFSSIQDNAGNVYTIVNTELAWGIGSGKARQYRCDNCIGHAALQVTVALSGAGPISVFMVAVPGAASASFDSAQRNADAATPFTGTAITNTQLRSMYLSFFGSDSGSNPATISESTGYSIVTAASETNGASFYTGGIGTLTVTTSASRTASFTQLGATNAFVWTIVIREDLGAGAELRRGPPLRRAPRGMPRFKVRVGAFTPVSAGQSATVGLNTETDSAFAIGKRKAKTLGLATQASSVLALTRRKSKALGLSSSSHSAFSVGRRKSKLLGLVSSAHTALAVIAPHFVSLGLASSANTALAIARKKSRALGLTVSSATAFAVAHTKRKTLGLASSANTAFASRATRLKSAGLAVSTNVALAVGRLKRKVLGLPTSSNTAFSVTSNAAAPPGGFDSLVSWFRRRFE